MLSRNIYAAGKERYTNFCKSTRVPVILTTEYTLILFLTDLATAYIFQATIKVYLSAVQNLHVSKHFHYEFTQRLTPQLQLILRNIKKLQASTHPPRIHLPIIIQILHST